MARPSLPRSRRSRNQVPTTEAAPAPRGKRPAARGEKPGYKGGRIPKAGAAKGGDAKEGAGRTDGFSQLLMTKARAAFPDLVGAGFSPEPLARLEYSRELELKNQALQEFWTAHALPDKPNRIVPSPLPRHYRTTTKRRVTFEQGRFRLDFKPQSREAGQSRMGSSSDLEPLAHAAIYAFLIEKLNTPAYTGLGRALNFLVIRGDYHRFAVFFNVDRLSADVARKAKLLAEHLQDLDLGKPQASGSPRSGTSTAGAKTTGPSPTGASQTGASPAGASPAGDAPRVASAYLFHDPGRSPFYLDDRAPEGPWKIKRLFGPDTVRLRVGDRAYAFKPTAFCQVNASILPEFLERAEQLLKPRAEQRLLDLYCGFGFFSLHLQDKYREVFGMDAAGASVESARDMAAATKSRPRFVSGHIRADSVGRLLPKVDEGPEAILLDPPRRGVDSGVIRELAARKPVRVLHVFCDMDTLPREVSQWRKHGYMIAKVMPLDMFPGTDNLEVMVAFIPDRYGILNRVEAPARNKL